MTPGEKNCQLIITFPKTPIVSNLQTQDYPNPSIISTIVSDSMISFLYFNKSSFPSLISDHEIISTSKRKYLRKFSLRHQIHQQISVFHLLLLDMLCLTFSPELERKIIEKLDIKKVFQLEQNSMNCTLYSKVCSRTYSPILNRRFQIFQTVVFSSTVGKPLEYIQRLKKAQNLFTQTISNLNSVHPQ